MASTKRKDSKGYALRVGECQRKDGRYSYTDRRGKRFTVYEKSLVDLRAREKEIRIDIYAEATQEKKQEVMANLQGKIF